MSQEDAAAVVEQLQPRVVLPMHYFTRGVLARFLYAIDLRDSPVLNVSRETLPPTPTVIATGRLLSHRSARNRNRNPSGRTSRPTHPPNDTQVTCWSALMSYPGLGYTLGYTFGLEDPKSRSTPCGNGRDQPTEENVS
jgi:hypothetical protein